MMNPSNALLAGIQISVCLCIFIAQLAVITNFGCIQETCVLVRDRRDLGDGADQAVDQNADNGLRMENSSLEPGHDEKEIGVIIEKYMDIPAPTTEALNYGRRTRPKSHSKGRNSKQKSIDERRSSIVREDAVVYTPPAAIHFVGDTSNYSMQRHAHYAGNGRIKISGVYTDWRPANWVSRLGYHQHFQLENGKVSVNRGGLYLLYAQIHYADIQEVNCFRAIHEGTVVAQCCSTTPHILRSESHEIKANTCTLMTTVYLRPADKVWLTDVHERYVILSHEKSYFGLVQLAPE